jgi:hypothetical protein
VENLGFNLKLNGRYDLNLCRQHYADIDNELAKDYNERKEKLLIRDEKGEAWALVDKSLKLDEFEAIHSKTAVPDMDNVITPFMNKLRHNPLILNQLEQGTLLNDSQLAELRTLVLEFAKQMKLQQDILLGTQEAQYSQSYINKEFMQNVAIRIKALEQKLYK